MGKTEFFYKDDNAPDPMGKVRFGSSVLMRYENKLLLERRSDSNTWSAIGGGIENRESFMDCAVREVKEETGIDLDRVELRFFNYYDDPSRIVRYADGNVFRLIGIIFITELKNRPNLVLSNESKEMRFFTTEELKKLDISKTHIPIISDYIKRFSD